MTGRHRLRLPAFLALPAGIAVLLLVLPLAGLLARVSWGDLPGDLTSATVLVALRLSLETSLLSMVASVLVGVPLAFMLARLRTRVGRVLRALVTLPLVLPPVVAGIALQAAFGRSTPAGHLLGLVGVTLPFSTAGAVLAETFVAFPFLVVTVEAALRQRDEGYEEAAATLGAGPWQRFRHVSVPLLAPSLAAGAALCWARALGEFGATITFAGSFPGTTQTLPLAAYADFEGAGPPARAVALALIILVISVGVLVGLRDRWLGAVR